MSEHEKLHYLEYPARDLRATKAFFESVFGWRFTDYGPEYTAFDYQGLEGGFFKSEQANRVSNGGALSLFLSLDLEATLAKVEATGAEIVQPIFEFPGGRRFHFLEPSGNEFGVWTEQTNS